MNKAIKARLIALYKRDGTLTPEAVVADAKKKASPLHEAFVWDVNKAAEQHWLDTARALIRTVKLEIVNKERVLRVPYFVRDPRLPADEQGYVGTQELRNEQDIAREAVLEECGRAASAFKRAQDVAAAVDVETDVLDLLRRTMNLQNIVRDKKPTKAKA